MTVKHFVEFRYHNFFTSNVGRVEEVLTRDPQKVLLPCKECIMFRFFDCEANNKGIPVIEKMYNVSGWYYPEGHVYSYEDIAEMQRFSKKYKSVLLDMQTHNITQVVETKYGHFFEITSEDHIL